MNAAAGYEAVAYGSFIVLMGTGVVVLVRRWRLNTRNPGDSLRGEYLTNLGVVLFGVLIAILFGLMAVARLFGGTLPRPVVMTLLFGALGCIVAGGLGGVVAWFERRSAGVRDAQLGITGVKPRRLPCLLYTSPSPRDS